MPRPETLPPKGACRACQLIHSWAPSATHTCPAADFTLAWGGAGLLGDPGKVVGCLISQMSPPKPTGGGPPASCLSSGAYLKEQKGLTSLLDWLLCDLIGAPTSLSPALCNENEEPRLARQRNLKVACASQGLTKRALFCCQAHSLLQPGAFVGSCWGRGGSDRWGHGVSVGGRVFRASKAALQHPVRWLV